MRATRSTLTVLLAILTVGSGATLAADPPDLINYQGVLRSATDVPQDGDFEMVFRFFDADVGGNEILVDEHLAAPGTGAVTVTGGLFSVALGSGDVADGSGPGTFSSLGDVFRRVGEVYLEVQVEGEVLLPRTRVVSAAYSMGDIPTDPPCFDTANRFVDCGNGTVTDTETGLIWLRDASCAALGFQNWTTGNQVAASLEDGMCGLTDNSSPGDWRLPTKAEWEAIIDVACNPTIPDTAGTGCWSEGNPFSGVQANAYWSSTGASNPITAWRVSLSTGAVITNLKTVNFLPWLVRGRP